MEENVRYAMGEQDLKALREHGNVYVDKTLYVEKIEKSGTQYYFLPRPRCFGNSLFLSTLRSFFEGESSSKGYIST